jgi:hypothetical protein
MRHRSSFVALLVFAAGACTAAPDSGGQTATVAPATTATVQASTAMKRRPGSRRRVCCPSPGASRPRRCR